MPAELRKEALITESFAPKILFYNWVPSFDPARRGGGVSVYQDNCILNLQAKKWEAHSLSSGLTYDFLGGDAYIKSNANKHGHLVFEIINSPVPSPTYASFFANQISGGSSADEKMLKTFADFIVQNGPYDVIHFNNLEGFPAAILPQLRQKFPETKFIFSLHNYYPMCPQVYLWKNDSFNCDSKEEGNACVTCPGARATVNSDSRASDLVSTQLMCEAIPKNAITKKPIVLKIMSKALRIIKTHKLLTFIRGYFGKSLAFEADGKLHKDELLNYFATREDNFIKIINSSFDSILCVSDRVKKIALASGLDAQKVYVNYIGTKFYETRKTDIKPINTESPLHVGFLGYANKVKGFDFLLSALEQLPDALLARLHVMIAAQGITGKIKNRLSTLEKRLSGLKIYNGYSHAQLSEILSDVDLGIVPVVWEDCLPQVAIELVCNGVPIITSNLGGAREIASNENFEFTAGSYKEFSQLLQKFADDKIRLKEFWDKQPMLKSMEMHISELTNYYAK